MKINVVQRKVITVDGSPCLPQGQYIKIVVESDGGVSNTITMFDGSVQEINLPDRALDTLAECIQRLQELKAKNEKE